MIRELVTADPALNEAAWDALRSVAGLISLQEEPELPSRKVAGGYLEF